MPSLITYIDNQTNLENKNYIYYGVVNNVNYTILQKNTDKVELGFVNFDKKDKENCYRVCESSFEKILNDIAPELNQLHAVNFTQKNWHVIIGRWLKDFIYICYKNFISIENIYKHNKIESVIGTQSEDQSLVSSNWFSLLSLAESPVWNSNLNLKIIKFLHPEQKINTVNTTNLENNDTNKESKKKIDKEFFKKTYQSIRSKILFRKQKIFLYQSGLSSISNAKLEILMGQLPNFWQFPKVSYSLKLNQNLRDKIKFKFIATNNFEVFLKSIIRYSFQNF